MVTVDDAVKVACVSNVTLIVIDADAADALKLLSPARVAVIVHEVDVTFTAVTTPVLASTVQ